MGWRIFFQLNNLVKNLIFIFLDLILFFMGKMCVCGFFVLGTTVYIENGIFMYIHINMFTSIEHSGT